MVEKFANLAKKTRRMDGGRKLMGTIKMGIEAKGHALDGGFCIQGNKQTPFVCAA